MIYSANMNTGLAGALQFIERVIRDGLAHGHFEYAIHCELIGGEKRRLIITAGKSHQFIISPEELHKTAPK